MNLSEHVEEIERQKEDIYRSISRYKLDRATVEDIYQSTMAGVWKTAEERYDPDMASFKDWVIGCFINKARDYLRRRKTRREVPFDQKFHEVTSNERSKDDELFRRVNEDVDNLDDQDNKLIRMHYFGDMSYEEIARSLNINTSKVGGRLVRARKNLNVSLSRYVRGYNIRGLKKAG